MTLYEGQISLNVNLWRRDLLVGAVRRTACVAACQRRRNAQGAGCASVSQRRAGNRVGEGGGIHIGAVPGAGGPRRRGSAGIVTIGGWNGCSG